MTRRTWCTSVIAAAALLTVASACGGSSGGGTSAVDFVRRVTTEFSRGRSGRL
jgi:hypothetical protein